MSSNFLRDENIIQYLSRIDAKLIEKDEFINLIKKSAKGHKFRVKIGITPNNAYSDETGH